MPQRHRLLLVVGALLAQSACTKPEAVVLRPRLVVVEAPQPANGAGAGDILAGAIHARIEADLSVRVAGKIAARKVGTGAHVVVGTILAVLRPAGRAASSANRNSTSPPTSRVIRC